MKTITEYYKLTEKVSNILTPIQHSKNINNNVVPEVTKASVEISDYLEFMGANDKTQRQWLKLTGDAQMALLELADFIKKNMK